MVSSVPDFALVRGDEGLVVGQRVDVDRLAVDVDQRHARGCGRIRHGLGGRGVDRVDDDRVHVGGDEIVDLVKLLGDVVLRVLDLHLDPVQGTGILDQSVPEHGQEVVVEPRHRHGDGFSRRRSRD